MTEYVRVVVSVMCERYHSPAPEFTCINRLSAYTCIMRLAAGSVCVDASGRSYVTGYRLLMTSGCIDHAERGDLRRQCLLFTHGLFRMAASIRQN